MRDVLDVIDLLFTDNAAYPTMLGREGPDDECQEIAVRTSSSASLVEHDDGRDTHQSDQMRESQAQSTRSARVDRSCRASQRRRPYVSSLNRLTTTTMRPACHPMPRVCAREVAASEPTKMD
jgi:hypothetical protein